MQILKMEKRFTWKYQKDLVILMQQISFITFTERMERRI